MEKKLFNAFEKLNKQNVFLQELLSSYTQDILLKQTDKLSWSALQVCHHMYLVEKSCFSYVKKKILGATSLKNANVMSWFRYIFLKIFLRINWKIKAPAYLDSPSSSITAEIIFENWRSLRLDMQEFLENFPFEMERKELFKHPLVGRLTLQQMLLFLYEHNRRHLKQIFRVLRIVKNE